MEFYTMFPETILFLLCSLLFSLPLLATLGGGLSLFTSLLTPAPPIKLLTSSAAWHRNLNQRLKRAEICRIEATKSEKKTLVFRGHLGRTSVMAFMDTGSDLSLVAKSLVKSSDILPADRSFYGVTGHEVKCYGMTTISPRFSVHTCPITAYVVNDEDVPRTGQLLLGSDWQYEHDVALWIRKRLMTIGSTRHQINAVTANIELKHTTTGTVPTSYLDRFKKLFSDPSGLPPSRPGFDVKLKVNGKAPPSREIRIKDPSKAAFIKAQWDLNLARGFITKCTQPEVNPCSAFVVKSGGTDGTGAAKMRLVLDFVKLNDVTDVLPSILPRISDLIRKVCKAKHFSKIDIRTGFHNLRIHPDSIPHTATLFPGCGIAVWNVLPMGLADAPGRFQALMMHELADLIDEGHVVVYLDDILVFAEDQQTHDDVIERVLRRLEERSYHLAPSKCAINVSSVDFLGHRIEGGTFRPQHSTVQGIVEFPFPATIQQWQRFHGMANFYRMHVPRFSDIMKPIASILGISQKELEGPLDNIPKDTRKALVAALKNRDDSLVKCFKEVKKALAAACPLTEVDPTRTLYCITDASKAAWGSVVTHDPSGKEAPIAWLSGTFSSAEKGWHSIDREIFALVASIRRYPEFFSGPVTVLTDSMHLKQWTSLDITSERLARWNETLASHQLTITHLPGKENIVADALSRSIDKMNDDWSGTVIPPSMIASLLTPETIPGCATPPPASNSSKTSDSSPAEKLKAPVGPPSVAPVVPPKTDLSRLLVTRKGEKKLPVWSQAHIDAQKNKSLGLNQAFDDKRMIDVAPRGSSFARDKNARPSKDKPVPLGCPPGCTLHFGCRASSSSSTSSPVPAKASTVPKDKDCIDCFVERNACPNHGGPTPDDWTGGIVATVAARKKSRTRRRRGKRSPKKPPPRTTCGSAHCVNK